MAARGGLLVLLAAVALWGGGSPVGALKLGLSEQRLSTFGHEQVTALVHHLLLHPTPQYLEILARLWMGTELGLSAILEASCAHWRLETVLAVLEFLEEHPNCSPLLFLTHQCYELFPAELIVRLPRNRMPGRIDHYPLDKIVREGLLPLLGAIDRWDRTGELRLAHPLSPSASHRLHFYQDNVLRSALPLHRILSRPLLHGLFDTSPLSLYSAYVRARLGRGDRAALHGTLAKLLLEYLDQRLLPDNPHAKQSPLLSPTAGGGGGAAVQADLERSIRQLLAMGLAEEVDPTLVWLQHTFTKPLDPPSFPSRGERQPTERLRQVALPQEPPVEYLKLLLLLARYYPVSDQYRLEVALRCQARFWQLGRWDQFDLLQMLTLRMPADGECAQYLGPQHGLRLHRQRPASQELNYQRAILRCLPSALLLPHYRRWRRRFAHDRPGGRPIGESSLHRISPIATGPGGHEEARRHLHHQIQQKQAELAAVPATDGRRLGTADRLMRLIVYYYLHYGEPRRQFASLTRQLGEEDYACRLCRASPEAPYYALALGYMHCF